MNPLLSRRFQFIGATAAVGLVLAALPALGVSYPVNSLLQAWHLFVCTLLFERVELLVLATLLIGGFFLLRRKADNPVSFARDFRSFLLLGMVFLLAISFAPLMKQNPLLNAWGDAFYELAAVAGSVAVVSIALIARHFSVPSVDPMASSTFAPAESLESSEAPTRASHRLGWLGAVAVALLCAGAVAWVFATSGPKLVSPPDPRANESKQTKSEAKAADEYYDRVTVDASPSAALTDATEIGEFPLEFVWHGPAAKLAPAFAQLRVDGAVQLDGMWVNPAETASNRRLTAYPRNIALELGTGGERFLVHVNVLNAVLAWLRETKPARRADTAVQVHINVAPDGGIALQFPAMGATPARILTVPPTASTALDHPRRDKGLVGDPMLARFHAIGKI